MATNGDFGMATDKHEKRFARRGDAQRWLDQQTASIITGGHVAPRAGRMTVGELAERW